MIYFDNNATTNMSPMGRKSLVEWCNKGNASASYKTAVDAKNMMQKFRDNIITSFNLGDKFNIIFNSGGSESNCTVLRCVVDSYAEHIGTPPHIVMSAIEHKSLLSMAESLAKRGLMSLTLVKPSLSGHILPKNIESVIRSNTALICVMHANNETGAINDIAKIGAIAHAHKIPFHSDTVQTFGKIPIDIQNLDSFCASFHKIHGPPGVGSLIIRKEFINGHELCPLIFGSQNDGLRGGTENIPCIGASYTAFNETMTDRNTKNGRLLKLKMMLMEGLAAQFPARHYTKYAVDPTTKSDVEIIFLSGMEPVYMPGTTMLSVLRKTQPLICNVKLKKSLEERGIIVSIGSACNTTSVKSSHVLNAMDADSFIKNGALRVSMGDENTADDVKKFITIFSEIVRNAVKPPK